MITNDLIRNIIQMIKWRHKPQKYLTWNNSLQFNGTVKPVGDIGKQH